MTLTVVMYHYVRRLAESRYPEIKGLDRESFIQQLEYIRRFYTPVTGQQVIDAVRGAVQLPTNAILLTFDDGYLDHFMTVFPILMREKISGVFFPPARCILENRVLDVNKIHYILAAVPDKAKIVAAIDEAISEARDEYGLGPPLTYRQQYAVANRFDPAEVIYIKRMLQVALPAALRVRITDQLFACHVSSDEKSFARELYMDEDQVRCLVDSGMMVGSHGYNHEWLNRLDRVDQAQDIAKSLDFLRRIEVSTNDWVMCYPYGGWSESVLELLRAQGCAIAFTTETALAHIPECDPLLLPRLDTNDLPKNAAADAVSWTRAIQGRE
jgi:peptidoglycan/xylan/chitin deacetylase (PgdA/CDA1 family)